MVLPSPPGKPLPDHLTPSKTISKTSPPLDTPTNTLQLFFFETLNQSLPNQKEGNNLSMEVQIKTAINSY